ncbi:cellulase family glycosylhydrolase [Nocardia sp. NRRL S-836]|uniref:cellulase family glycosylhydrolase n=1 Tax=Nocardia sp. NRRL S-836 TaxID=1519492 RepID=UPI0006AF45EB|nr:cellulase family glycosylhydrolase [Nocardia sp. NRRL S-836]KOV83873.1 beta-mannosidase [Nocardia sp. NRRL S-836]
MKRLLALASTLLVGLALLTVPSAAQPAAAGFHVNAGRLYDATGAEFVMRGVNHAHTWYTSRTTQALADVKALRANTVRVVLSSGDRWTRNDAADVANVIAQCKRNRLICVLEVHDTTGYGEQSGAVSLAKAVDYWIGVQSAMTGQEAYVILNIGNEPWGNTGAAGWTADTKSAISRLRAAGFTHTIMVDAPNWGQDWSFTMRDNAASVFAADPQRNTVFSVHMYGVFDTAAEITDYLGRFVAAGLPVVVGEFGHNHSDGDPDEDTILSYTQSQRLGYLGWSWSGNGGGVEYLDMATGFDATRLTSWGQRIFNGPNGIVATSREAAVFGGGQDTTAPTTPGTPAVSNVTGTGASLTWAASTDTVGVTAYQIVRVDGGTESPLTSTTTPSATLTNLTPATAYTVAVYALDAAGNRSTRSPSTTFTTGTAPAGTCAVAYRVTGQWSGGFQGEVKVQNTGTAAVNGWALRWTFANGQTVTQMWNATAAQSGAVVTATNAAYNAAIPAGGAVSFGFTGAWTGANAVPGAFTLNGAACSAV